MSPPNRRSPRHSSQRYQVRLLEFISRRQQSAPIARLVSFDAEGNVLAVTLVLSGSQPGPPVVHHPQALFRALMRLRRDPEEFAEHLFIWNEATPNQILSAHWDPRRPWQLQGEREVICFDPGELEEQPLDRATAALIEMGFVAGSNLTRLIAPCPDIAESAIRWLLRHPFVTSRRGRRLLRIIFSGASERYYKTDTARELTSAMNLGLQGRSRHYRLPPELTDDGEKFIHFCKCIRRALRSDCLKDVLGYGHPKPQPPD